MPVIDYSVQKTFSESLEVDDIGDCAICCSGLYIAGRAKFPGDYVILIRTVMGMTKILKWGPVQPDIPDLPNGFKLDFKEIKYKESAILREITTYINDAMKFIDEARIIGYDEAIGMLPKDYNYAASLS